MIIPYFYYSSSKSLKQQFVLKSRVHLLQSKGHLKYATEELCVLLLFILH